MDPTFSRVLLFRHLAICASALMAYALRSELQVGYAVLAIVGGSAALNFALYLLQGLRGAVTPIRLASSAIGVGSWASLIAVTKGVGSPFIAGLWLELILSSMVFSHVGIFAVTAAAVLSLIGQQMWLGLVGNGLPLALEAGFLVAMGSASGVLSLRDERREFEAQLERERLGHRVQALVEEVHDERELGRIGESVGRLAHGLKNKAHSLRGFVALLEPSLGDRDRAALAGLHAAIDDLEDLARTTLAERVDLRAVRGSDGRRATFDVIEQAIDESRAASPDVEWTLSLPSERVALGIPPADLHEVVQILLRNAVEAMDGRGRGEVAVRVDGAVCEVAVRDHGGGFDPDELETLFKAGFTTKPSGSGYGLFLARRVLSQHGGALDAENEGDGARFRVRVTVPEAA